MEKPKYILLLNEKLKNYVLEQNSQRKKRLREKFEFLENGLWDAGVRVKKLKGFNRKVIFEARLSKGDRLLFTLGRHDSQTAIYVWGLIKHDDISATAEAILPHNAPFLSFQEFEAREQTDLVIDDLSPDYYSQEDISEKAQEDYGPQKWLVLGDEEWERLLRSSPADEPELFLFLTAEQEEVLKQPPPLLLSGTAGSGKTTISVYYLFKHEFIKKKRLFLTYSPYLKRFSEKIYSGLLKASRLEQEIVPADFSLFKELIHAIITRFGAPALATRQEVGLSDFDRIFRQHQFYKKYDAELVWEEIRSIIKGAKPYIHLQRYKKLLTAFLSGGLTSVQLQELHEYLAGLKNFEHIEKIERTMEKKTAFRSYDEFLADFNSNLARQRDDVRFILEDIYKWLDKKTQDFGHPLLKYQDYLRLGKKRAPHFLYDRNEIYAIAEYYQSKLEENGLWDEIDFIRKASELLDTYESASTSTAPSGRKTGTTQTGSPGTAAGERPFLYDLVVCDEVQDFTDVALSFIFRLAREPNRIVFTGDPKQIINPSGFRWEEVKQKFYERSLPVPEVYQLNLNFRCVGSIVKLANALLDLKQELVGLSGTELKEDWKFNGKPPFLIYGLKEEDVVKTVRLSAAGQIVLVRDTATQQALKKALQTELVFTIYEAKGLEFDTVLLWKFSEDKKAGQIWRRIKQDHYFDTGHYPHIKHEINLLYVALTRARNTLIIYDGQAVSDIWDIDKFANLLFRTNEGQSLLDSWQHLSTPAEWEKQGDYFYEREYYPAAYECYKNAGHSLKAELASAFMLAAEGRYSTAAELFAKHNHIREAALNFEAAHDYARALPLWKRLKDKKRTQMCRIRLYETEGRYDEAAAEWVKLGDYEQAGQNWEKAGNYRKLADYYYGVKDYKQAARYYEMMKAYGLAANCYRELKQYKQASELYEKAGQYEQALVQYKKLKDKDNQLNCYLKLKDYYQAALIYENKKDREQAKINFEKFAALSAANKALLRKEAVKYKQAKSPLKAALRYAALGDHGQAAKLYLQKGLFEGAIEEYKALQDYEMLAKSYTQAGQYYEAALAWEQVWETNPAGETGCTEADNYTPPLIRRRIRRRRQAGKGKPQPVKTEILSSFHDYIYEDLEYDRKRAKRLYEEAEALMQAGSFEKALFRYKAIFYADGIYRAYSRLQPTEEALCDFLHFSMFEYVSRYLKTKAPRQLSASFVDFYCEHLRTREFVWYQTVKNEPEIMAMIELADYYLSVPHSQEDESRLRKVWQERSVSYDFMEHLPEKLLDFLLKLKAYNLLFKIFEMMHIFSDTSRLPVQARAFLKKTEERLKKDRHTELAACYAFYRDNPGEYEKAVRELELSEDNLELFAHAPVSFTKVVAYYQQRHNTQEAVKIAKYHRAYEMAARLCEQAGWLKEAGQNYREAKQYQEALRCFTAAGDEPNIARTYERLEEWDKALELWKKLGKQKEVKRVHTKRQKAEEKHVQPDLFEEGKD